MSQEAQPSIDALEIADDLESLDSLVLTVVSSERNGRGRAASSCCCSASCCCCSRAE